MYTSHGHHIKGTVLMDRPPGLLTHRCGGPGLCRECSKEAALWTVNSREVFPHDFAPNPDGHIPEAVKKEDLNDQQAVVKVYDALRRVGLSGTQIIAFFNDTTKSGIIFRMEKD
jgi:hypothetical protein